MAVCCREGNARRAGGGQACNIAIVALVGVLRRKGKDNGSDVLRLFFFFAVASSLSFWTLPQPHFQLVAISKTGRKERFLN